MGPGNFAHTFGAGDNRIYNIVSYVVFFYNLHVILTILHSAPSAYTIDCIL